MQRGLTEGTEVYNLQQKKTYSKNYDATNRFLIDESTSSGGGGQSLLVDIVRQETCIQS